MFIEAQVLVKNNPYHYVCVYIIEIYVNVCALKVNSTIFCDKNYILCCISFNAGVGARAGATAKSMNFSLYIINQ
jgi:hypothetical protein